MVTQNFNLTFFNQSSMYISIKPSIPERAWVEMEMNETLKEYQRYNITRWEPTSFKNGDLKIQLNITDTKKVSRFPELDDIEVTVHGNLSKHLLVSMNGLRLEHLNSTRTNKIPSLLQGGTDEIFE